MHTKQQLIVFIVCVQLTIYMCNASVCNNTKENFQTTQTITDSTTADDNTLKEDAQTNQQNLQDDGCQTLEVEFKCGQELKPYTGESKYVLSEYFTVLPSIE